MPNFQRLVIAAGLLAMPSSFVHGDEAAAKAATETKISYYREIRPILEQKCQGCHQPAKPAGSYVMTAYADILKPGASKAPGIVPGQAAKSGLYLQITPEVAGDPPRMPKEADPLPEAQVKLIEKWIAQGAVDDTPASGREIVDSLHPPKYRAMPVVTALAYSPDGALLAVSGYHEVLLHKADGSGLVGRLVGLSDRIQSLAFSPDGKLLAVAGGAPSRFGEIQVWNVAEKKLLLSQIMTFDTLYGVSWSTDGSKLAFGGADNTVRAIDAKTGQQVLFQGAHSDWVLDTVFSTDSSHLVTVSRDMSMKLTEVATQRFVDNVTSITPGALKGGLLTVDRHPTKDELLVGGADGIPKIYKMYRTQARQIGDDANLLRQFEPMPGRMFAGEFNRDGSLIAVASSLDGKGEVRVYNVADGKVVSKFAGTTGGVYAVAFQPDSKQVASAGFDGMVRINDPVTGKLTKEFVPVPLETGATAATDGN